MIDLPKDIHFVVKKHGEAINRSSIWGLNIRWGMAMWCRERGITNMLQLTGHQRAMIDAKCVQENERMKISGWAIQVDFIPTTKE